MKTNKISISISYPPLISKKGIPFLAQNRQFQWTNTGNVIYPVIPAYAASALKQKGYKVFWDDAIAEKISYEQWLKRILKRKPNLVVMESKTPVIKTHWQIIEQLKQESLKIKNWKLKIVLIGDHVTALPEESLNNSPVDYVITGGDFDFMLLNLVDHLVNKTKLEPGFWFREKKVNKNTGAFALKHHNLDSLPIIDRDLTKWKLYAYNNTNYKFVPGTYMMSGRDCWWGKCTFCSWTTTHPGTTFRAFSVKHTLDEIGNLIEKYHIKEIFDDAGTFPIGPWLKEFCEGMIERGYNKKIKFGCNMRFAALNQEQYDLMGKAGFRFILYGLESSNQETLDKIKKNTKVKDSRSTLIMAKKAGLEPHLTIMIGYPWETKEDATRTLNEARELFKDGLADSMQATIIIPYPGTPLFKECQKENLLLTENWDDYDMRQQIIKSKISGVDQVNLVQGLFKGVITPKFLIRKIVSIRSFKDIKFLSRYAVKYIQKLQDFPIKNG
ncbi:MAG: radical SAM protein [Candidatus Shapirobacteria bacterium]|nr:radical SAM protein [Candidatus Shapirobacteria bacterium]